MLEKLYAGSDLNAFLARKMSQSMSTIQPNAVQEETESTDFRLIKLDNSALAKDKSAYVYDLVKEKVTGYRSIKQMKMDVHDKIEEMS